MSNTQSIQDFYYSVSVNIGGQEYNLQRISAGGGPEGVGFEIPLEPTNTISSTTGELFVFRGIKTEADKIIVNLIASEENKRFYYGVLEKLRGTATPITITIRNKEEMRTIIGGLLELETNNDLYTGDTPRYRFTITGQIKQKSILYS